MKIRRNPSRHQTDQIQNVFKLKHNILDNVKFVLIDQEFSKLAHNLSDEQVAAAIKKFDKSKDGKVNI